MEIKGKRLLLLGGAAQCLKVVTAAKELGVYTIVTDIAAIPAVAELADECLSYSVTDAEGIYNWCAEHPVDGILNYCVDYAQKTHNILCERLGLPCYGTGEQYHYLTDKKAFKKLCAENGVGVIPEYDEDDPGQVEYPVMVKPAESSGSRGSTVCYDDNDLRKAIDKAKKESKNGHAIIEKYLYGKPDFSMSYIVIDGEPHLIRTLDRFVGRPEDNLQRQCICSRSPSVYTELYLENAHEKVVSMLKKLGLKNATVFMQGFIDDGVFRFYDPGIRFPGSEYERMLKGATGVDVVKPFIRYALGGTLSPLENELKDVFRLNGYCGLQLFIDGYPGTIGSISGADEVAAVPGVTAVIKKHDVGYEIPDTGDVKRRLFEVVTVTENSKDAVAGVLRQINENLSVRDTEGKDLLTPMIDAGRLFGR